VSGQSRIPCTADLGRSRAYDQAVKLSSGWAGGVGLQLMGLYPPAGIGSQRLGLPLGGRQSARTWDLVRGLYPMCLDLDGFSRMKRLEEGALGDPVLAGNIVYYLDEHR
jgi:hypothetical protein